ncbi:MAG: ribonuclease HII [Lachnospiraceae bacterium]|nr:ribonuclease HII [Lachnospiraceae bacterium]
MARRTLEEERAREYALMRYEREYEAEGLIAGIDEAGRGPLAGPVVAAAVILYPGAEILGINDSKKLSEKAREALYPEILERSMAVGIGIVSAGRIDEINILQATYEAMRKAVSQLCFQPDVLLVDAVTIPGIGIRQVPIIKGDAKSLSIGAASIIAKVTRDRMMRELDEVYPEYGFAAHKGYGTAAHIAALKEYGPCPIHRTSFISHFVCVPRIKT